MRYHVGQRWGATFGPMAVMSSQIVALNYVRSRGNVPVSEEETVDGKLHSHGHPTNEWGGREHSDGQVMKFQRKRGC